MIKMIATDIDGTILKYNYEFNQPVIDCIKNLSAHNIPVVLVTGRMHGAAKIVADKLDLKTPIISYQGGLIKDGDKVLYEKIIDPATAKKIINWGKSNNIHLQVYINDNLYVEHDNDTIKRYILQSGLPYITGSFDNLDLNGVNKILAIDYNDSEKVSRWVEYLQHEYPDLYIVKSTPYFCEISNKEATKACALEYLRNHWGLKKEEIMTIGDQNNDIVLLKAGGLAVAMGNATDELKACADYVTDTIDNDGFVKAVEKFVLVKATD